MRKEKVNKELQNLAYQETGVLSLLQTPIYSGTCRPGVTGYFFKPDAKFDYSSGFLHFLPAKIIVQHDLSLKEHTQVVAHELGHAYLYFTGSNYRDEVSAEQFGLQLLKKWREI